MQRIRFQADPSKFTSVSLLPRRFISTHSGGRVGHGRCSELTLFSQIPNFSCKPSDERFMNKSVSIRLDKWGLVLQRFKFLTVFLMTFCSCLKLLKEFLGGTSPTRLFLMFKNRPRSSLLLLSGFLQWKLFVWGNNRLLSKTGFKKTAKKKKKIALHEMISWLR